MARLRPAILRLAASDKRMAAWWWRLLRGGYPKNTVIIDVIVMQGIRVTVAAVGRGYPKATVTAVTNRHPLEDYPPKEGR